MILRKREPHHGMVQCAVVSVFRDQRSRHLTVVGLTVLALFFPAELYLISLALFGLPHVICELNYLYQRYAGRWPWRWWLPIGLLLGCQAVVRTGVWLGSHPPDVGQIADLATLMGLALVMAFAPMRVQGLSRILGILMATTILWLLQQGAWLTALLLLSIAHNFTPLGFALDLAREDVRHQTMLRNFLAYFSLPVLVVLIGWSGNDALDISEYHFELLRNQIPIVWQTESAGRAGAIMSAVALAQCLHYLAVIWWIPRAISTTRPKSLLTQKLGWLAALAVVLLLIYFWTDNSSAKQLYSIAAGFHAWLEWPVLIMQLLGQRPQDPAPH